MTDSMHWGSDVPISMPLPLKSKPLVPMYGFVFTEGGIAHDLDEATYLRVSTPTYAPDDFGADRVREDLDVDDDAPPSSMETF